MGVLWLLPQNRGSGSISSQIASAPSGATALVAHLQGTVAHALVGLGTGTAVCFALISFVVGLGPLVAPKHVTAFLVLGVALALDYWVLGQSMGGLLSGTGTDPNAGPLFVLFGLVLLPNATVDSPIRDPAVGVPARLTRAPGSSPRGRPVPSIHVRSRLITLTGQAGSWRAYGRPSYGRARDGGDEHVTGARDESASMEVPISGHCETRFAAVREAFVANFLDQGEVGAAVTVLLRGEPVVELVGGWRGASCVEAWQRDTVVNVYSVGKAFVALLLLQLVDKGEVRLDDPIASVWPEFAGKGKARATVRQALCHQAGVPAIRQPLTNADLWRWDTMASALAATEPWWEAGKRHAYHTNTYGHLIGEPVHRITGELPGTALRSLAAPLGADLWFGLPAEEHHRCAEVVWSIGEVRRRSIGMRSPATSSWFNSATSIRRVTRRWGW